MAEGLFAEGIKSLEDALPIALICTRRSELQTCGERDRVEDVVSATRKADYDYVPVTRGA